MRKLKFHEKKLLKKVDFISWEADNNLQEVKIMKRYCLKKREDYTAYNHLSRHVRELARKIRDLEPADPFRVEASAQLLQKLYSMGLIPTKNDLNLCDRVTASSFCRRRLPVIMVKSRMAETIRLATQLIEQGHVRVGADVVRDPAFLVTRNLEDFVTWRGTSAIRQRVLEYNEMKEGVNEQRVKGGVNEQRVKEGVNEKRVKRGVKEQRVKEGVNEQRVKERVNKQRVNEGVIEQREGVNEQRVKEGVNEQRVKRGVKEQRVKERVKEQRVKEGVNEQRVKRGVKEQRVKEGVNEQRVEERVNKQRVNEGVIEQRVKEGVNEQRVKGGVNEQRVKEGVNEQRVKEGVNEQRVKGGVNEQRVKEGVNEQRVVERELLIFVSEDLVVQLPGNRGSGEDESASDCSQDHPLNPEPDSDWQTFFRDNEVLLQIDKDVRRLCPDICFFQRASEFPASAVVREDRGTTRLHQRVQMSALKATSVVRKSVGGTMWRWSVVTTSALTNGGCCCQVHSNHQRARHANEEDYIPLPVGSEAHWEVVERILFIYAKLNPGQGYVQGMNEIIGPIYYTLATDPDVAWREHAESDTFFCFTQLMSEIRDFFIKSLDRTSVGILGLIHRLDTLLKNTDMALWSRLNEQELKPQFYSFRWLTLLLSQEFSLPDVIRIWDSLFADEARFQFLIDVCLAMLILVKEQLMEGDFSHNMKLLQNYPCTDVFTILSKAMELSANRNS
ncbi:unnamed protein product [Cyprideis torosa]|uniref:TBC1 domain family member 13 n=1 Tax=Cyprideis torosa TaxID=163714 RepID=A0A7R8ZLI4_9CRUS|nr:unnamed protein product [Cyprideis torosa]CAG0883784.1 unnamed protein product [Cyprideis torosa]